jgi:pilus assembly protein CpaF
LVRFEARRAQNAFPVVEIRDLLKAALRHRPDRIMLGEIRGGEAFDLLQLLNTGHSVTLSTIHANSAKQALARFTSCVLQSDMNLLYRAIKTVVVHTIGFALMNRCPGRRSMIASRPREGIALKSERQSGFILRATTYVIYPLVRDQEVERPNPSA